MNKKVLICDDNRDVSEVIGIYLEEIYDCECVLVQSYDEILPTAMNNPFDLILLELQFMHRNDSSFLYTKELCRIIRCKGENVNTPVVAFTVVDISYDNVPRKDYYDNNIEYWDELKRCGFNDVLLKPFTEKKIEKVFGKFGFIKKQQEAIQIPETLLDDIKPYIYVLEPKEHIASLLKGSQNYHIKFFSEPRYFINHYSNRYYSIIGVVIDSDIDPEWKNLLRKIMSISALPKVIVAGKKDTIPDAVEATKLGASAYISKNLTNEALIEKIHNTVTNPVMPREMDNINKWIRYNETSSEELLERLFTVMFRNIKILQNDNLLKYYLEKYKNFTDISLITVRECIESYLGKTIPQMPKAKLLIVEDEEDTIEELEMILENYFHMVFARTKAETLTCLKQEKNIDIILLDVRLPDGSAEEIYDEINALKGKAEVIVVTAYAEAEMAVNFIKQNAFDYVEKPYELYVLIKKIGLAWIHQTMQLPDTMIDLQELPLVKRLCFINELFYAIKQQGREVFMNDIYAIFPEIQRDMMNLSVI